MKTKGMVVMALVFMASLCWADVVFSAKPAEEAASEGWKTNVDGLLLLKSKQDKLLVKLNVTQR